MGAIRRPTVAQDDPLIGQTVASSNRYCASRSPFLTTRSRRPCNSAGYHHSRSRRTERGHSEIGYSAGIVWPPEARHN
jgi:hypothetical protein